MGKNSSNTNIYVTVIFYEIDACLDRTKIPVSINIGYGDIVYPEVVNLIIDFLKPVIDKIVSKSTTYNQWNVQEKGWK